jgi:biopolymer transport protein ExbD
MARRRRRKTSSGEEVELNLAAMLDMAFQLLTFFILTFNPPPAEGQIELRMPPPVPVTKLKHAQTAGNDASNKNPVQGLDTLTITAFANQAGQIASINLQGPGQDEATPMGTEPKEKLYHTLRELFGQEATPFEQVILQSDERLLYGELMRIIEVCTHVKLAAGGTLTKLSVVSLKTTAD